MGAYTSRYLISATGQPRMRRAGDVTGMLTGGLLLLWALLNQERIDPVNRALSDVLDILPEWTIEPLSVIYTFGFLYSVTVLLLLLAAGRSHRDALRDVAVALLITAVVGALLVRLLQGEWPQVLPELVRSGPERQTPVFRISLTTAVLVSASPHLALPLRRLGWGIVFMAVLAGSGLGFGLPSDAIGAVGVGMIAAGAVFLVLGAPSGLPDLRTISTALDRLGLPVTELTVPASRSWGVRPVLATTATGARSLIKVYGRDATDQQLLARLWRSLWYREQRRTFTVTRLQRVQQEALLTLWAARAGVPVPEVLAAGAPDGELAVLALSTSGTNLDRVDDAVLTDAVLTKLWRSVAQLHAAGISHGALDTGNLRWSDGEVVLHDLDAGSLSATPGEQALDVVELLFCLAVRVGPERAVATAREGLGDDALAASLPYLQLPALRGTTRARAEHPRELLAAVTAELTDTLGVEPAEPVKLRRVSARSALLATMGAVAAVTVVPAVAGIDLVAVGGELRGAVWTLVVIAWVIGQAVFITEATSMMFATTAVVPFRPLIVLQIAAKFVGVAAPGVTGTVATNATFLSRFGVPPAASLTQGTMDAVAGILVEIVVLATAFTLTDLDLGVDLSGTDLEIGRLVLVVAAVLAIATVVVLRVPRLRAPARELLATMWEAVRGVVADPTRAIGLLGGNLATRIVRALVLWFVLVSLDQRLGLAVVLVVVIATGLLQAVVPVPGGIGVAEALMTGFLVALGVPEAPAFAATVTYRMIIFYIPVVQGTLALRWLAKRSYL